jgi:hypothetical protein
MTGWFSCRDGTQVEIESIKAYRPDHEIQAIILFTTGGVIVYEIGEMRTENRPDFVGEIARLEKAINDHRAAGIFL